MADRLQAESADGGQVNLQEMHRTRSISHQVQSAGSVLLLGSRFVTSTGMHVHGIQVP